MEFPASPSCPNVEMSSTSKNVSIALLSCIQRVIDDWEASPSFYSSFHSSFHFILFSHVLEELPISIAGFQGVLLEHIYIFINI